MKKKKYIFLICYLVLAGFIFHEYSWYLRRPASRDWDRVNNFFRESGQYQNEYVRFRPHWLRNYATDWGRLRGINFDSDTNSDAYWLVTHKPVGIDESKILHQQQFEKVRVLKIRSQ